MIDGSRRDRGAPERNMHLERLTNDEFMPASLSLRIDHDVLHQTETVHWHEFYEIQLITAGTGTHVLNGRALPLVPGDCCLLTPADFHEIIPDATAPLELFNVIFTDDLLAEPVHHLLFAHPMDHVAVFAGADFERIVAEFRCLWAEVGAREVGYERVIQGVLERILITMARHGRAERCSAEPCQDAGGEQGIRHALVYLHHHFREPLTLARVARQAHLSPHYFSSCFHRDIGQPFQTYLRDLRLHFACALLRVSDLPVTEVCHASGFTTLSHFDRAFKSRYGQSPRAYRATTQAQRPSGGHEATR